MRVFAVVLVVATTAACTSGPTPPPTEQARRCAQLIAYFDRYGSSRSANSDGFRNHARIGAEIDCRRGQYGEGIATMGDLLRRRRLAVPPPSS